MLAEIFMLQLESAYRASDDMIQSKKFRFVPLPEIVLPISEAADRIDDTYKSLWHTMHDDVYTYAVSAAIAFGIALSVWLCGVWLGW
jgi:hypothetical protein